MARFWLSFHCRKLWLMGLWGHISMVMRFIRGVGIRIHGDGMGYGGISTYPWWWGWESRIHGDCGGIYIIIMVIGLGGHISMVMGWEIYSVSMVRAMYPWLYSHRTLSNWTMEFDRWAPTVVKISYKVCSAAGWFFYLFSVSTYVNWSFQKLHEALPPQCIAFFWLCLIGRGLPLWGGACPIRYDRDGSMCSSPPTSMLSRTRPLWQRYVRAVCACVHACMCMCACTYVHVCVCVSH